VATIELLDAGAAPLVVVGTTLIINLRLGRLTCSQQHRDPPAGRAHVHRLDEFA
jgi:hypothetical protein